MLTAVERLTRLDKLARRLSQMSASPMESTLHALISDACDIVANSPAPIDPLLIKAREIAVRHSANSIDYNSGKNDDLPLVTAVLEALRSTQEPQA